MKLVEKGLPSQDLTVLGLIVAEPDEDIDGLTLDPTAWRLRCAVLSCPQRPTKRVGSHRHQPVRQKFALAQLPKCPGPGHGRR